MIYPCFCLVVPYSHMNTHSQDNSALQYSLGGPGASLPSVFQQLSHYFHSIYTPTSDLLTWWDPSLAIKESLYYHTLAHGTQSVRCDWNKLRKYHWQKHYDQVDKHQQHQELTIYDVVVQNYVVENLERLSTSHKSQHSTCLITVNTEASKLLLLTRDFFVVFFFSCSFSLFLIFRTYSLKWRRKLRCAVNQYHYLSFNKGGFH